MKTKTLPAIIMLLAGFIACIAGMGAHMELADFMKMLLIVLILFYLLGCVVKVIVDKNFTVMIEETTDGSREQEKEDTSEFDESDKEDDEV